MCRRQSRCQRCRLKTRGLRSTLDLASGKFYRAQGKTCWFRRERRKSERIRHYKAVIFWTSLFCERDGEREIKLTPRLSLFSGLFAAEIGIFFGYYPSRKVSELDQ